MIDQDLLTAVQIALVEPPNGGLAWPSELWTVQEMYGYLDGAQQDFLKATHALVGLADIPGVIDTSRYALPDDWIATVLVAWRDTATNRVRELLPTDSHQADLGMPSWVGTSATPLAYSDADTPTRTIQIIPAPSAAGTLHLVYVPSATHPIGAGEPLQLPDEWCTPVLKYAVLADALAKVGRALDPQRAGYCAWRRALGEQVTQLLLSGMA